jgi:hypothetical protein
MNAKTRYNMPVIIGLSIIISVLLFIVFLTILSAIENYRHYSSLSRDGVLTTATISRIEWTGANYGSRKDRPYNYGKNHTTYIEFIGIDGVRYESRLVLSNSHWPVGTKFLIAYDPGNPEDFAPSGSWHFRNHTLPVLLWCLPLFLLFIGILYIVYFRKK